MTLTWFSAAKSYSGHYFTFEYFFSKSPASNVAEEFLMFAFNSWKISQLIF